MKHASSRLLFADWQSRRSGRAAPERAEIEPGAIRHALPDIFLLGRDAGTAARFRLAGTRVCAQFGRELKGEFFAALFDPASRRLIEQRAAPMADDSAPVVFAVTGHTVAGDCAELELLLLPLLHHGRGDRRAIGALGRLDVANWISDDPVERLSVKHFRALEPGREPARPGNDTKPRVTYFRGLTVYEGGLVERI